MQRLWKKGHFAKVCKSKDVKQILGEVGSDEDNVEKETYNVNIFCIKARDTTQKQTSKRMWWLTIAL